MSLVITQVLQKLLELDSKKLLSMSKFTPSDFPNIDWESSICKSILAENVLPYQEQKVTEILNFFVCKYSAIYQLTNPNPEYTYTFLTNDSDIVRSGSIKWIQARVSESDVCELSAKFGNLEVLEWARKNGFKFKMFVFPRAAENGHLEVLKWARKNGYELNRWVCSYAAFGGHLEILKWARKNGCDWDEDVCSCAAENGHLEILKWARKNGCKWSANVCERAAANGHLELIKWSVENGCKYDDWMFGVASENGQFEVLEWANSISDN